MKWSDFVDYSHEETCWAPSSYSTLEKQGQIAMHLINMSRGIDVFHEFIRGAQHAWCCVVRGCDDSCNSMQSWPIMHNKGSSNARLWLKANILLRPRRSAPPPPPVYVLNKKCLCKKYSWLEFWAWLVFAMMQTVNCTGNMSTNTRLQLSIAVQANNDCTNVPVDAHCSVIFKWFPLLTKFRQVDTRFLYKSFNIVESR